MESSGTWKPKSPRGLLELQNSHAHSDVCHWEIHRTGNDSTIDGKLRNGCCRSWLRALTSSNT